MSNKDVITTYERIEKSRSKKIIILEYYRHGKEFLEEVAENIGSDRYREELFSVCYIAQTSKRKKRWHCFEDGLLGPCLIRQVIRTYRDAYDFFVKEQFRRYRKSEPQREALAKVLTFRAGGINHE